MTSLTTKAGPRERELPAPSDLSGQPGQPGLEAVMRPLRRRALLDSAARWALWGGAAWATGAVLVLAWSKVHPTAGAGVIALAIGAPALVGAACAWAWRRPSMLEVARLADARLDLKERLASALYFAATPGELAARLRADAIATATRHDPADAFPLGRHRYVAAAALAVAVVAAALALTPNPQAGALARQAADQAVIARARDALSQAHQSLAANRSVQGSQAAAALQQALARLQRARSPLAALVALSKLSSQLQSLSSSSSRDQEEAAAAAGQALSGAPGAGALAADLSNGNLAAAASQLRAMSGSLSHLTSAERQALAKALDKAAQAAGAGHGPDGAASSSAASGPGDLPDALAQAGSALAAGHVAAAGRYLGAAANGAAATASAASVQQELDAVEAAIQNAQAQVAGEAQGSGAGQGQAGDGDGAGPAGAQPGGTGQGAGQGQGDNAGGSGASSGGGAGGSGGSGAGGGSGGGSQRASGAGAVPAPSAQVFVGGQPGGGEQVTGAQLGDGRQVSTQDYRAVLPSFEKTALLGLGTEVVAPVDQELVRTYFTSLGSGQ
jgi:hypothetical protein